MNKIFQNKKITISAILTIVVVSVVASFFIFRNQGEEASAAAWFSESYYYRKTIEIGNATTTLTDFQVKVLSSENLVTDIDAGKIQADLDDIRFTDKDGNLLDYWIEDNTATTTVNAWVKFPTLITGTSTVYMYYGNPSAEKADNPQSVFLVWDDFNDNNLNLNYWRLDTQTAGSITETGQALRINENENYYAHIEKDLNLSDSNIAIYAAVDACGDCGHSWAPGILLWWNDTASGNNTMWTNRYWLDNKSVIQTVDGVSTYYSGTTSTAGSNSYVWYRVNLGTSQISYDLSLDNSTWTVFATSTRVANLSSAPNMVAFGKGYHNSSFAVGPEFDNSAGSPAQLDISYINNVFVVKYADGITVATPTTEEQGPGPVGYWNFDEGYGATVNDSSSSNNDGTITNAVWKNESECKFGKCLYFDGTGDYINVSNTNNTIIPANNTAFSISFWLKANDVAPVSVRSLFVNETYNTSGFRFGIDNNAKIYFWSTESGGTINMKSSQSIQANQWYHVEVVYDGSSAKIYLDSIEDGSDTSGIIVSNTNTFKIAQAIGGKDAFKGFLDEIKVYPYARTVDQVKQDYNKGTSVSFGSSKYNTLDNTLIGYWKMDELASSTCVTVNYDSCDSSGNNNDGNWSVNAFATTTAKFGRTVDMDGVDDFLSVDSSISLNSYSDELSMSGWFYLDTLSTTKYLFDRQNNFYFRVSSTGAITMYLFGINNPTTLTTASGVVTVGNWFHVAFTYNGRQRRIYVNGKIKAEDNKTGSVSSGGALYIASQAAGQNPIDGRIDEVRIYNSGLSPEEVRYLYEWAPGPVAHYSMNTKSGTNIYDRTGNSNDLIFSTGMDATTDWVIGKYGSGLLFDDATGQATKGSGFPDISSAYTVSSWVKLNNSSNNSAYYISFSNSIRMSSYNSSNFDCAVNDGGWNSLSSSVQIPKGEWHYLTCTYDGATRKIYYDGVLKNSIAYTDNVSNSAIQFGWGDSSAGIGGVMDDVKVYDYARTPRQILEDMNAGKKNNPIGYWSFDEGQGITAYDYGVTKETTGSGNDGTLINMSTSGTSTVWSKFGKSGGAIDFDGVDDEVDLGNDTELQYNPATDTFSLSAWINIDTVSVSNAFIAGKNSAYGIDIENDLTVHMYFGGSSVDIVSDTVLETGSWYHIVGVFDAGQAYLYIDGELDNSGASSGTASQGSNFKIGGIGTSNFYFNGMIDEIKLYNYKLTQDEIRQNYNQGLQIVLSKSSEEVQNSAEGLVGWWKMDESSWAGVAGEVIDYSGAGSDGTAANSANTTSTAKFGRSGYFLESTNDYISVTTPTINFATTDYTFQTWIKRDAIGDRDTIIYASAHFGIESSNKLFWNNNNGSTHSYYSASTVPADIWTHVAITIGRQYIRFYINGVLDSESIKNENANGQSSWKIGSLGSVNTWDLTGYLDDFKIYASERSAEQIMSDYIEGPPPIGYWKMDEKTGSTTVDNSGTGNTGTITGAIWKSSADCKIGACLNFGGSDYVDVGAVTSNSKITFTTWFKSDYQDRQGLIDFVGSNLSRGMFNFDHIGNERPLLYLNTSNYRYFDASAADYLDNEWHFLTLYIPGGDRNDIAGTVLTIDGNIIPAYSTTSTDDPLAWDSFYIGRGYSNDNFQGMLDEVKIFNYELTQRQIIQEYNNGAPVGYWKLDKGEGGTAYDYSGNANDGTVYPGTGGTNTSTSTMWSNGSSGKINGSMDFDGTDDKIEIDDNTDLQIQDELTVCAWVYANSASASHGVFEKTVGGSINTSYLLFADTTKYNFRVDMGGTQTIGSVRTLTDLQNAWAHICGSYSKSNNGRLSIFVNGIEDNFTNITANSIDTGNGISYIGMLSGNIYPFNGQIDEVKVWNYALTPEEIKKDYNGGFGIYFK